MPHVQDGETRWTIEHNAAAGFLDVLKYLKWRTEPLQALLAVTGATQEECL